MCDVGRNVLFGGGGGTQNVISKSPRRLTRSIGPDSGARTMLFPLGGGRITYRCTQTVRVAKVESTRSLRDHAENDAGDSALALATAMVMVMLTAVTVGSMRDEVVPPDTVSKYLPARADGGRARERGKGRGGSGAKLV